MKINSLEFKNYRCFKDARFDFEKNGLNIVIGKNGSGKTELLYAIEWILYGLDFSQLQGKTANPYALNSDLYRNYTNPNYDEVNEAHVIMEFEHPVQQNGKTKNARFWLKKSVRYTPNGKSTPIEETHSQLSVFDDNGNKLPPLEDEKCLERIKKIIPRKVLSGLLFDGERMKALSNDDENSRNTIDGFISEITNIEQLSFTKNLIDTVKKDYSRDKSKLLKNEGFVDEAKENDEIQKNEDAIKQYESNKIKAESLLSDVENKLRTVNAELERYKEIKVELTKRDSSNAEKKNIEASNTKRLDNFQTYLGEGYLLHCNDLFDEVNNLIEMNDVPTGLTVEAVESILKMDTCICGEPWTEKSRQILEDLKDNLPPGNLNASISQTINSIKRRCSETDEALASCYKDIRQNNKRIAELNRIISEATNTIGSSNVESIRSKENERQSLDTTRINAAADIKLFKSRIKELNDENRKKLNEINDHANSIQNVKAISAKFDYAVKCINIINEYIELNKKESLDVINKLISEAYKQISEEYELKKRIYITQFTEPKYKIITYFEDEFEKIYKDANWPKLFTEFGLEISDIEDDEKKREIAIIKAADNSSTGQRKIVTLSFVKAVMEFSMSKDSDSEFRSKKEYPLFIDAPFSELSGENLSKFAKELPNFNDQSIVMLDPDIYEDIKEYFESKVVKEYLISKSEGSNNTQVKEVI